jgi:hypothetical protein
VRDELHWVGGGVCTRGVDCAGVRLAVPGVTIVVLLRPASRLSVRSAVDDARGGVVERAVGAWAPDWSPRLGIVGSSVVRQPVPAVVSTVLHKPVPTLWKFPLWAKIPGGPKKIRVPAVTKRSH